LTCPSCGQSLAERAAECDSCGLILAKWRRRTETRPTPLGLRATRSSSSLAPQLLLLFAVVILVAAIVFLASSLRDLWKTPASGGMFAGIGGLATEPTDIPDFDVMLKLPGSPLGAASNGHEIVLGNRDDPWGFIRLSPKGNRFAHEIVPVIEPRFSQKISLHSLTWNGQNYVGITKGSWFGSDAPEVFTIHDPATLQVLRHYPAPPLVGCVAWDGASYWAATRKNTEDADGEAFLYRLDEQFKVTGRFAPPAVGCQGLTWDGAYLWFVDLFQDSIYVLDVSEKEPRVLHKAGTPFNDLSGIVLHGGRIWIATDDSDRLFCVRSESHTAWIGGSPEVPR
jgi:hypothetical protein